MHSIVKCIIAVLLVAQTASAFIPVTSGPTLSQEQGKAAGIGGLNGPKGLTSGGVGAFSIKGAPKKNEKATPKKAPVKKNNFFAAKKVTNTKPKAAVKEQPANNNPFKAFLASLPTPK